MIRATVIANTATPVLNALYNRVAPGRRKPLMTAVGRRVERLLRRHFTARDAEGNKRGWPRSHFWSRIRRATAFAGANDVAAKISISDPALAMKVHGGKIYPTAGRQNLALPLRPEAKIAGSPRAKLIPGLFVLVGPGRAWLARREDRALRLYYKLVKSVTQTADPRALPYRVEIYREVRVGITTFLKRETSSQA
ncbi:hypothetical protein [Opitutus terrae]|uniref:Phage virion morphogenesis protein n=1 Tax=Opitutus terrae (strain DSM 11246 / JCM 15787 / PB90-1) TaxID=452637 RepID=B1ZV34_OPITP|nr:hypothetical protein [Opitutus terrae]ACB76701.1 hypothetical protein Oter_3424 [Opitutus terrae PB90-1]